MVSQSIGRLRGDAEETTTGFCPPRPFACWRWSRKCFSTVAHQPPRPPSPAFNGRQQQSHKVACQCRVQPEEDEMQLDEGCDPLKLPCVRPWTVCLMRVSVVS
mmetsp:Transcript_7353/g.27942  ORF Transcript_7353/g.27942 Transcript_7353/m.27942 type:complete len:103 (-) Transcript_7353:2144-2452(-)